MTPLLDLGLIAAVLFAGAWGSRKLRLSPVLGYLALGMVLGPRGPLPLIRLSPTADLLSELGLVLLLFTMGLEFSLARFVDAAGPNARAGLADLANLLVGFAVGLAFGFGWLAALFLGGVVYVSSSGVIVRLLSENDLVAYPEAERALGVLVFEDLAMVVLLAVLGLLTAGAGWLDVAGALLFLALYLVLLRYGRPLIERAFGREDETLVLFAIALVTLVAVGARTLGFPEAVAAFLLGMAFAESSHRERIERALSSWYHLAAAAFFLGVGLHVDLASALGHLGLVATLLLATLAAGAITGYVGGRRSGLSRRASLGHGLLLVPRGEFSLVIATLAAGVGAFPQDVRDAIQGATSLYVASTVLIGSLLFGHYRRIDGWLARVLEPADARARRKRQHEEIESVTLD